MLIFKSVRGRKVVFDDYCVGEDNAVWCEMCPHCHDRFKNILKNRFSDKGDAQGICSVVGCSNDAEYYVDFEYRDCQFKELDDMGAESLMEE